MSGLNSWGSVGDEPIGDQLYWTKDCTVSDGSLLYVLRGHQMLDSYSSLTGRFSVKITGPHANCFPWNQRW
jgi:hypothetical protein